MFRSILRSSSLARSFTNARPFSSGGAESPTNVLFLYGLPTGRHDSSPGVRASTERATVQELYSIASEHAPVRQIRTRRDKNFGWLEFENTQDAASFKEKYTAASPLTCGNRSIPLSYSTLQASVGKFNDDSAELSLLYNPTKISIDDALNAVKERFPGTSLSTNVKTSTGSFGTIFIRFDDAEKAKEAFENHQEAPLELGGLTATLSSHCQPSTGLVMFNLRPFADYKKIRTEVEGFGPVESLRLGFHGGPRVTGRAHVHFVELSSAIKFFEATMNEDVKLNDVPIRAEYLRTRQTDERTTEYVPKSFD